MGTALRWLAGLAGLAGIVRLLRRRGGPRPVGTTPVPPEDDPAEELRRKLAEAREQPQTPVDADAPRAAGAPGGGERSLDDRRGEVHARARDAIDAMRGQE